MLPITRLNNCQVIVKATALDTDSPRLVANKHNLVMLMSGFAWLNKKHELTGLHRINQTNIIK